MLPYKRLRWVVVGLLLFATIINYVDRQTLSILSTTLRKELHLTDQDYSNCVSAFLVSYAVMYAVSGRLIDRVGVRVGAMACVIWWSCAAMLTGLARGPLSLAFSRFLLGIGEPGIYPAGLKAASEWFPRKLRGTAIGIYSSGGMIGAMIAAPLIAWLATAYGWRAAFVLPGLVGLVVWLPLWYFLYRNPAQTAMNDEERAALQADTVVSARRSWWKLLQERKVWGLVLCRLCADPVWYLYLFWLPDYFQRVRGMSLLEIGIYAWIPYLAADFGCIFGGMMSDRLIRAGWAPIRARFAILTGIAVIAPLGAVVGLVDSTAVAMAVTCVIAFLCQASSVNVTTMVPDLVGGGETASVLGLLGSAGSFGGVLFAQVLGVTIALFGYSSAFIMAAALHPLSLLVLFLFFRPELRAAPKNRGT